MIFIQREKFKTLWRKLITIIVTDRVGFNIVSNHDTAIYTPDFVAGTYSSVVSSSLGISDRVPLFRVLHYIFYQSALFQGALSTRSLRAA